MKVKKAVIPVAGLGTRFLPFTKAVAKEMLPILNVPVIQYIVEELAESGIEEILMITNRGKNEIEDHFDENFELFYNLKRDKKYELLEEMRKISNLCKITFIRQKQTKGLGHAVLQAENFVKKEPFALLYGDELVYSKNKPAMKQVIEKFEEVGKSIIGCKKVEKIDISKYGCVEGKEVGKSLYRIISLEEKPNVENAKSDIAIMGRHVLMPEIFSYLKDIRPGVNGEIQLTDAMNDFSRDDDMYAYIFEGKRYDTGNLYGYLEASVEYGLRDKNVGKRFRNYLKNLNLDDF
ncbi:MAG: UTP--glucose-1-phosphate uridylyltransferase GalU [Peptoniphilaceae bacterium]|nr:UTP--glucose-1-phosphate uridylyltransferase GalU [Peptoniphilaceae bacterium]MDD7383362.1 UTP--glucose-1-phosphate uridylyltransferase GalU [Peptoniphilaceae bacterium]MDY3738267.1 UTP--glucose-1-phosphate uridylyltransferase GalU [Peptoniphilaceae bacterium]